MSAPDASEEWPADWAGATRAQRRTWARLSADERLRWLEDALRFAQACGALERDRRRRAAASAPTEQPRSGP
ncbi:MAG TPA: hypothetical protein VM324_01885 [Egibacteraceae bacterium]|nr:hypothetical protein [Egibacteraceae bacterium]